MIESCTDVCQGTFRRAVGASKMTPESVRPSSAGRQLGKTFYVAVQGREVTAEVGRAVGKHAERNSPSREWFALYSLCKVLG